MRIPESKIEEIRTSADIVDVVSSYVQLRKRGKNFLGLCPFHTEKTPSFTVSPDKQIFHCFGCHSGGNVFKFLMDYKKISYIEAVQELANQLGIAIEYESYSNTGEVSETELLFDLNTEAAKYFSENLLHKPEAEIARNYFEKRKIKIATIRSFGLGYASSKKEDFVNYLREKNLDLEKASYLGLIGKRPDDSYYEKFSGRIIFPLFSPNGRVVAFAGRILEDKDNTAKYLNSPESKIYYKGKTLYGLSFSKDAIRKDNLAIIVEGYMDLISLHQNGIKNVVAVSGTALTDEQVQLLSRYTKNVVLIFDADEAGVKASMRSIEILLKQDFNIKIATLPQGEDPDSFVRQNGKNAFEEVVNQSENFLEYQTEIYQKRGWFDDPVKSTEAIREIVKQLALLNDDLKKTFLIKSLSDKFSLREKLLETELEKISLGIRKNLSVNPAVTGSIPAQKKLELDKSRQSEKQKAIVQTEKNLIKLLCEGNDELNGFIFNYIKPDEFSIDEHRKIASVIFQSFENDANLQLSAIIEKIDDEKTSNYLREINLSEEKISDYWDEIRPSRETNVSFKVAADCIKKIKIIEIEMMLELNHKRIESENDNLVIERLLRENKELSDKRKLIEKEFA